jgi:ribose transport system ATP-binding protein
VTNLPASTGDTSVPLVELFDVSKSFGGVHALKGVNLVVPSQRVVGLAGENGAGKSTLLKILSGVYVPDSGEVRYDGIVVPHPSPSLARNSGIGFVAQELALFEHLTVAENIMIGQEPRRRGLVDRSLLNSMAAAALAEVGATSPPMTLVRELSFADRQIVEIARALVSNPRLLVLDEPTSGLRAAEVDRLLQTIIRLRDQGRSVVFITHRMSEMFEVCDQFTVLKDGESVASLEASDTTPDKLVRLMVGRTLSMMFPPKPEVDRSIPPVLELAKFGVSSTQVESISLKVFAGEIVGIAGLAGNGQNELLEAIAGLRSAHGRLRIGQSEGPFHGAGKALKAGITLVPEDRKRHGLILPFSVKWNLTLPNLGQVSRWGFLKRAAETVLAKKSITSLAIKPADDRIEAIGLSGGNQQKVVIGRSLLADPDLLVLADPTRGIDVGTKQEIYSLLRNLGATGKAILLMSSDLNEMVGISDRVLVMSSGAIVEELVGSQITEERITSASFAGKANAV